MTLSPDRPIRRHRRVVLLSSAVEALPLRPCAGPRRLGDLSRTASRCCTVCPGTAPGLASLSAPVVVLSLQRLVEQENGQRSAPESLLWLSAGV